MKHYLVILGVLLIIGCKSKDKEQQPRKPDPTFVEFKFNPAVDKQYVYSFDNTSEMIQEVDEKKYENSTRLNIETGYNFSKDTNGTALQMQYKKFKLYAKIGEQEKDLNAATAGTALFPADKMFSAFDKATITINIDSAGKAKNIMGLETIKSKMAEIAGNDEDAKQMLEGSIKQYVSEQSFKQLFESSVNSFSSRKIKVGDTLMTNSSLGGEFNINTSIIYKLEAIKNGIATFSAKADIDVADQPLVIENVNVNTAMKGEQAGSYKIDIETGMLVDSETKLSLKGTMNIMGKEVPFKMKTSSKVGLKK
jgi:hypothetical protein